MALRQSLYFEFILPNFCHYTEGIEKQEHNMFNCCPLIYSENQWTGFYMIVTSIMRE